MGKVNNKYIELSDLKKEIIEGVKNPNQIGIGNINKYIEPKVILIKKG